MSDLLFEDLLRKSRAFETMLSDIKRGLGHAYMIVSADDDLVDSFLTLTAAAAMCKEGDACMRCAECHRVLHSTHADVMHLNKERKNIGVGQIKELLDDLYIRALGTRKIYIIHRADLMLPAVQNKLLKTLEEPPENVTFLLGVANERSLLDTVRSRARAVYLDSFEEEEIYNELIRSGKDEHICAIAAACADGMPGKALLIADSKEYASYYDSALSLMDRLNRSSDVAELGTSLSSLKNPAEFADVLSIIVRDMLVGKRNPDLMMSKHLVSRLKDIADKYSERALSAILFEINNVRKKLRLNVNALSTIDSLLFSMLEVRYKWQ